MQHHDLTRHKLFTPQADGGLTNEPSIPFYTFSKGPSHYRGPRHKLGIAIDQILRFITDIRATMDIDPIGDALDIDDVLIRDHIDFLYSQHRLYTPGNVAPQWHQLFGVEIIDVDADSTIIVFDYLMQDLELTSNIYGYNRLLDLLEHKLPALKDNRELTIDLEDLILKGDSDPNHVLTTELLYQFESGDRTFDP